MWSRRCARGEDVLPPSSRLRVLQLDVTDVQSIRNAVRAAGPIDGLANTPASARTRRSS